MFFEVFRNSDLQNDIYSVYQRTPRSKIIYYKCFDDEPIKFETLDDFLDMLESSNMSVSDFILKSNYFKWKQEFYD